jgi:microsomal dipeptidase-like Zn-dependent dipeptidase
VRLVIVDLHAHYPMHLVPDERGTPLDLITNASDRRRLGDRVRALLVGLASRFDNYRSFSSGPRVTIPSLQAGGVGVALSVLYAFFDEVDLSEAYGAPPKASYLDTLVRELELVEQEVSEHHSAVARVARSPAELEAAIANGKIALVHCVEGGFHLGGTPAEVDAAVTRLASRGVAYVTLAHLFFRRIATNAPALPFLSDRAYRVLFPQPAEGLTELGRAAVTAMVRERILIDVSHMTERSLSDTLDQLDVLDPGRKVPLIATHCGLRFGTQEYNLSPRHVEAIAARDGVIGLIFAQHQLLDGLGKTQTATLQQSLDVICRHVDGIARLTGSQRHVALGSDFDGFIKPTLGGLETAADMAPLELALRDHYGEQIGAQLCSENALRPLRSWWRGGSESGEP